jgi:hypothetical protein
LENRWRRREGNVDGGGARVAARFMFRMKLA